MRPDRSLVEPARPVGLVVIEGQLRERGEGPGGRDLVSRHAGKLGREPFGQVERPLEGRLRLLRPFQQVQHAAPLVVGRGEAGPELGQIGELPPEGFQVGHHLLVRGLRLGVTAGGPKQEGDAGAVRDPQRAVVEQAGVFGRQRLGESQGLAVLPLRFGRPAGGMQQVAQVGVVDRQRPPVVRHVGVLADQGLRDDDGPVQVLLGVLGLPAVPAGGWRGPGGTAEWRF